MKIFFWILLVVNVVFFATMKMGVFEEGSPVSVLRPLNEQKMILMPFAEPESMVVPAMPASAVQGESAPVASEVMKNSGVCLEWGEFSGSELDNATNSLKKLGLGDKLSHREIDQVIGYWVYIPPMEDKLAVNQMVEQIKARGVTDYFVVKDPGVWHNAISLGLFKTQESAKNFMQGLRNAHINSAKMGERAGKNRATIFTFSHVDAKISAKLTELQKEYSTSELNSVTCP